MAKYNVLQPIKSQFLQRTQIHCKLKWQEERNGESQETMGYGRLLKESLNSDGQLFHQYQ